MVFDSAVFLWFFLIVLGVYWRLPRGPQNWFLLGASYLFYGWWDWRLLSLVLLSTVLDFYTAIALEQAESPRRRRWLLGASVFGNLGLLAYFKYYDFFVQSLHAAFAGIGVELSLPVLNLLLPVGISFYTLQTLTYTIDVYKRELRATYSFRDFALFVAFFPHMVAGPIMRAVDLLPQIQQPRRFSWHQAQDGSYLILWGLYKKVFVADNLALIADPIFNRPQDFSAVGLGIGLLAFTGQIYGDFSAYSDIARGTAKWMGFELITNFNHPYFARNPSDFWRRWHISLSLYIRDYLYFPLGGGKGTPARVARNLFITMFVSGLWHGAHERYILWGIYHGLLLIGYRWWTWGEKSSDRIEPTGLKHAASIAIMFGFTCLGWAIFRSTDRESLAIMLRGMATKWDPIGADIDMMVQLLTFSWLFALMDWLQWRANSEWLHTTWPWWLRGLLYITLYFSLTLGGSFGGREFIYFQF